MDGTVKWFNSAKGFGFLAGDDGSDCFVHFSVIEMDGYKTIRKGDRVRFEMRAHEGRLRATQCKLIQGEE
ncbi:unnamed protein product [marine sediment metagenome]|uniref:CSD domain-containing protein n=1 Tax=marine sediment metagenome TaxID=412755 RepID=X0UD99_9ZZZZ